MKFKYLPKSLLLIVCTSFSGANSYAFLKDLIIWEQGDQYIELVPWDMTRSARNHHPIEIDKKQLSTTLQYLKAKGENLPYRSIFSEAQAEQLTSHLYIGLKRASLKLDLVFVVNDEIEKGKFISGRVFYVNGRLNLIFGDRNGEPGLRAKPGADFIQIIKTPGIQFNTRRQDWLILNYEQIASNIEIEKIKDASFRTIQSSDTPSEKETKTDHISSDTKAREVRELKLENARLKKRLLEEKDDRSAQKSSLAERLRSLKMLYEKKLITIEDYDMKRADILEDL